MELSGQRICITGRGEFIEFHLADRLLEQKEVLDIDRFGVEDANRYPIPLK